MRKYALTIVLGVLLAPAALLAQTPATTENATSEEQVMVALRDKLMPTASAIAITAPITVEKKSGAPQPSQPVVMASRGSSVGLMVAGLALFVAGVIVDDDAGTVLMVSGAAIGAYGLYLYFQ